MADDRWNWNFFVLYDESDSPIIAWKYLGEEEEVADTPQTERPCDNCQEWDCYGCDYKQTERENGEE